jgi:hypothetical protein
MHGLLQAYSVLSDAQQRQAYNTRLQEQQQDDLDDYTGLLPCLLSSYVSILMQMSVPDE